MWCITAPATRSVHPLSGSYKYSAVMHFFCQTREQALLMTVHLYCDSKFDLLDTLLQATVTTSIRSKP